MNQLEPIRRSVSVTTGPERAFEVFTAGIGSWWPLADYSRAVDQFEGLTAERIEFERGVGGRILEHLSDGQVLPWAEILAWEPPTRLVLAWKPNSNANPPTEIEVRFTPEGAGTLVELEHRGWERLGELAEQAREQYGTGWIGTLGHYRDTVNREVA